MICYEKALEVYNKAQAPKRSKSWLAMPDNARYLSNVRSTHHGIHKKEDGTIYFRLYDTNLVTFYPPNENGEYQVDVKYVGTQTTSKFMWWWGLNYNALDTSIGTRVVVPYVNIGGWRTAATTAKLVFNASDKLIVDKSWHREIYTKVSDPEDKAKRKVLRQSIKSLLTLTEFRIHTFKENCVVESSLGRPFGTSGRNLPISIEEIQKYVHLTSSGSRDVHTFDFSDSKFIELFMYAGQDVFNMLASKRVYKAQLFTWLYLYQKSPAERMALEKAQQDARVPFIQAIAYEDFSKAFTNRLLRIFNINEGSALKDWGQFRNKLPYKWYKKQN